MEEILVLVSDKFKQYMKIVSKLLGEAYIFTNENYIARSLRLNHPSLLTLMLWPLLWGFFFVEDATLIHLPFTIILGLLLKITSGVYFDFINVDIELVNDEDRNYKPSAMVFGVLIVTSFIIALTLGAGTLLTVILWALMVAIYPFIFNSTWWPQVFTGIVFGAWPVVIGQAATGDISISVILLMLAAFCWVLALETLRADANKIFNFEHGLKSIAQVLGRGSIPFVVICFIASFIILLMCGATLGAGAIFYGALMVAQLVVAYICQHIGNISHEHKPTNYSMAVFSGVVIVFGFMLA